MATTIKQKPKKKTLGKKKQSPIRWFKVREGRAIIGALEGYTVNQKIFELFKDIDSIDDGYSLKELALILFPNEIQKDKNGNDIPSYDALMKAKQCIKNFRNFDKNRSIILYSDTNSEGYWLFFNIPIKQMLDKIHKRIDKVTNGILQKKEKSIQVVKLGWKRRTAISKQTSTEFLRLEQAKQISKLRKRNKAVMGEYVG